MGALVRRFLVATLVLAVAALGWQAVGASERDRAQGRRTGLPDQGVPVAMTAPMVPAAPSTSAPAQGSSTPTPTSTSSSPAGRATTSASSRAQERTSTSSLTSSPSSPERRAGSSSGAASRGRVDTGWVRRTSAATGIPAPALAGYAGAAARMAQTTPGCRLSWNTIAALGAIESDHGRHGGSAVSQDGTVRPAIVGPALDGGQFARIEDTDGGRLDGDRTLDRAVGPLQFIPSTWKLFASDGNGDGRADPQNVADSSLAAGRYLCDGGRDLTRGQDWWNAVRSYNHSTEYVQAVLATANAIAERATSQRPHAGAITPRALSLAQGAYPLPGLAVLPAMRGQRFGTPGAVLGAALSQQGVPYSWGGGGPAGPGEGFAQGAGIVGFDCSSLMQYVFAVGAGIELPRVAKQQSLVGAPVSPAGMRPGDVIVFSDHDWGHVGLYLGNDLMVHAPFTGAQVRVQSLQRYRGQEWRVRRVV